jgi:hypothetical protein
MAVFILQWNSRGPVNALPGGIQENPADNADHEQHYQQVTDENKLGH